MMSSVRGSRTPWQELSNWGCPLPESRPWPLLPDDGLTLHHISDTHIGYRPWSYAESDHMLDDLNYGLIGPVDAMVHTGDIVDGADLGTEDVYAEGWLYDAARNAHSLWAMGNHDVRTRVPHTRAAWEHAYGRSANTFLDVDGYRIVTWAVDDHTWDDDWIVPDATWDWLDDVIGAAPGPVVLAQHFPPWELTNWRVNSLQPSAKLADLVGTYPAVAGMLCGHMHWEIEDTRAARFVEIGGRSLPVLTDVSSMLSIDGQSRDISAQFQSYSAYVTLYSDRWEVRYRAHGTHGWSGPAGQRVTTLGLADAKVTRGM